MAHRGSCHVRRAEESLASDDGGERTDQICGQGASTNALTPHLRLRAKGLLEAPYGLLRMAYYPIDQLLRQSGGGDVVGAVRDRQPDAFDSFPAGRGGIVREGVRAGGGALE